MAFRAPHEISETGHYVVDVDESAAEELVRDQDLPFGFRDGLRRFLERGALTVTAFYNGDTELWRFAGADWDAQDLTCETPFRVVSDKLDFNALKQGGA